MFAGQGGTKGRTRGRGSLRGAGAGGSKTRGGSDPRRLHFDEEIRGIPPIVPVRRGTSTPSRTLSRQPGRVRGALSRTFDVKGQAIAAQSDSARSKGGSGGGPSGVPRGGPSGFATPPGQGDFQQRYQAVRTSHSDLLTEKHP